METSETNYVKGGLVFLKRHLIFSNSAILLGTIDNIVNLKRKNLER